MNIRDAAIHCECKKIAYRQSKDGIVLSLLLHPQEVPDALATAPLGTRYMAALVEMDDNEQPVKRESGAAAANVAALAREDAADKVASPSSRPKRAWGDLSPAQQAGLLCGDPMFQQFLCGLGNASHPGRDEAAEAVRRICRVRSRAEITTDNIEWRNLVADFRAWERTPA